jgi:hypothetical protein
MADDREDTDQVYERWERDYIPRAEAVGDDVAALCQRAFDPERLESAEPGTLIDQAVQFVREQRQTFPHTIILFIYASRYDPVVAGELLDPAVTQATLPEGVTQEAIFGRKAAKLDQVFKAFALIADQTAHHYVAALMAGTDVPQLPLVWEVPTPDEATTGYPRDLMWWSTFRCLCELAQAIVAYGGLTEALFDELSYIRQTPHLKKRLLWLDVDANLFFPDRDDEQWPLVELPAVLQRIAS